MLLFIRREIQVLLLAIIFFTRIPIPVNIKDTEVLLGKTSKYLPFIGGIIGPFSALVFYLSSLIFTLEVSVILSMLASILLTGAFHEDGFADTMDGLGGGWTKQKKLDIMKDSRIGAYGVVGLIIILLLKFVFLASMSHQEIVLSLISIHILSRMVPVILMYTLSYVRFDDSSKSKPVAKDIKITELVFALISGGFIFIFLDLYLVLLIPVVFISHFLLKLYFKKHIGGYTGDCLGASQQISEVVLYACFIVICNYLP